MFQSSHARTATTAEIGAAVQTLFSAMPLQRGIDPDKALTGYIHALNGFSADAIDAGIRKFMRGECKDVSPKFCPHPPELANIVRSAVVRSRQAQPPVRQAEQEREQSPDERARCRLKSPMWQKAFATGRMDELAAANADGFSAMVTLATKWDIEIPPELLADVEKTEREWRIAHNQAVAVMERNLPPFLRNARRAT